MSINKLLIIFGITLTILAGILFFQFSGKSPISKSSENTVSINNQIFKVEVAKTSKDQIKGLSGRESLDQDKGMLFVFDKPDFHSFWMKKMKFPIDIIFIRDGKVISIIQSVTPPNSADVNPPILKPDEPADKVLEINAGLVKKYNIKKGDKVEIKIK